MNIGLFGGAFDPPHLGHLKVAETLLEQALVDEVWFVPVFEHPWAKSLGKMGLTAYEQRVEMLRLTVAVATHKDALQIKHYKGVSYAYDQLTYFAKKHPEHQFHWIMGSEYLPKFNDFLAGHPKLLDFHFFIYPRGEHPLEPLYENMTALGDAAKIEVSSTHIRELTSQGQQIDSLVTAEVADFIRKENLYQL